MRKAFSFSIFLVLAASQLIAAHKTSKPALDEAMRKLWTDHVVYTRLYIIAAVNGTDDAQPTAGDQAKQNDADRRRHQNAADIATFLSGANPHWTHKAVLDMLNEHLARHHELRCDFQSGNDDGRHVVRGIVKQFPKQFS